MEVSQDQQSQEMLDVVEVGPRQSHLKQRQLMFKCKQFGNLAKDCPKKMEMVELHLKLNNHNMIEMLMPNTIQNRVKTMGDRSVKRLNVL